MFRVSILFVALGGLAFLSIMPGCQRSQPAIGAAQIRNVTTCDGSSLEYVDCGGAGEAILFLPDHDEGNDYFEELAPHLVDRFRVLALTGSGVKRNQIRDAEMICRFLDVLEIERVHFVCASVAHPLPSRFAVIFPHRAGTLFCLDIQGGAQAGTNNYFGFPSAYGNEMLRETRRAYWAAIADWMKNPGTSSRVHHSPDARYCRNRTWS